MAHIINTKKLEKTPLRKKALKIVEAGYAAIGIRSAIKRRITIVKNTLTIRLEDKKSGDIRIDLDDYKRVYLVGIGKGSALASIEVAKVLGRRLTKGIAIDVEKPPVNCQLSTVSCLVGTHPLPSAKNVRATQKVMRMVHNLQADDLVIVFMCGGGSALAVASDEELRASTTVFRELTKAGANIIELNTVRKHLSDIKGGNLAKAIHPATVVTLMASDVIGNDMEMIASGPTVKDSTTRKDAENILKKYGISTKGIELKETPKEAKYFATTKNVLFISNRDAVQAMADEAKKMGFRVRIKTTEFQGEAKHALLPMVRTIRPKEAIIMAGETTVTLNDVPIGKKPGKGGRNQEVVLGVLAAYAEKPQALKDIAVVSYASDGRDNTAAAGAIGDAYALRMAEEVRVDFRRCLAEHSSYACLKKGECLLLAGQESFNVADLMMVIRN